MKGAKRKKAKQVAGVIIVEETQEMLDASRSPVDKGAFKRTLADGSPCQLFESGSMRDNIEFEEHPKGVKVGVFSSAPELDRLKASGHNKGDSANGTKREFVPTPGKNYKKSIMNKVANAINQIKEDSPTQSRSEFDTGISADVLGGRTLSDIIESAAGDISGPISSEFILSDLLEDN